MPRANTVVDVMLGEAGGRTPQQRYNELLHVASVMVNRANLLGVPVEDVALNSQFNAYGQRLPPGVESYRSLAEQALTQVLEQGPVTDATFYATPVAVEKVPPGPHASNPPAPAAGKGGSNSPAAATAPATKTPSARSGPRSPFGDAK